MASKGKIKRKIGVATLPERHPLTHRATTNTVINITVWQTRNSNLLLPKSGLLKNATRSKFSFFLFRSSFNKSFDLRVGRCPFLFSRKREKNTVRLVHLEAIDLSALTLIIYKKNALFIIIVTVVSFQRLIFLVTIRKNDKCLSVVRIQDDLVLRLTSTKVSSFFDYRTHSVLILKGGVLCLIV